MIKLEQWAVVTPDPYFAPEMGVCLTGHVYGHPKFPDGGSVRTSYVVSADADTGIVTTHSGREYLLGDVNAEYEAAYPNARERVFSS